MGRQVLPPPDATADERDGTGATSPPPGRFARWQRISGLDFHVLVTLLFRGWGILAGGATMILLPWRLDPVQQGYYYTFGSVLALQVFFELGFNQVVMQLVSHEAAHLEFTADGHLRGDEARLERLGSLVRMMRRWYAIAALLFAAIATATGIVFFIRKGTLPPSQWMGVWAILVGSTSLNLFVSPRLAMIEGCGRVGQVARLRLLQSMVGYGLLWALLLAGVGLWVAVAVPAVGAASTVWWLRTHGAPLERLAQRKSTGSAGVSWQRDILPLQWRIAVSWASGYFIFNLFTPIVFSHHGAAEAGRLGMAMSIFNAVTTVGLSWINAKAPTFTMHISRGESTALDAVFRSVALRSTIFTAALAFSVVGVDWLATRHGVAAASRVAPPTVLFWLAWATVVNVIVYSAATYMRAHREEPMVPVSVVTGLLTVVAVYQTASSDLSTMMILYAAIGTLVALPWTALLFRGYARRHAVPRISESSPSPT